ncbi:hypothetical protein C922_02053 [Plasmodium inui San Antonio 1]|uniref:Uncharacterized protein n=1 Tax=Plasmodium inui San Antonio 1 TaxID=1237626 RepID=W7A298_9APIC|nr:hypothetical protein C922_02053 [Plasmodium inui San Antonio 1]EUD67347.1 hypothetical protein C922_02053 [Plasmodium inui San Antonio 1]
MNFRRLIGKLFVCWLVQIYVERKPPHCYGSNTKAPKPPLPKEDQNGDTSGLTNSVDSLVENIIEVVHYLENMNNYIIDFKKELQSKFEHLVQHDANLYESYEYNENILTHIYSYNENKLHRYSKYLENLKSVKLEMFNDTINNIQRDNIYYVNFVYKNLLSKIDLLSDLNKKNLDKESRKNLQELNKYLDALKDKMMSMEQKFSQVIKDKSESIRNSHQENMNKFETSARDYLNGNSNFDTFSSYVINDFLLNGKRINVLNYENNSFFKSNFLYFNFLHNYIKGKKNEKVMNIYIYLKDPLIKEYELSYFNYYVIVDLHIVDVIVKNVEMLAKAKGRSKSDFNDVLICVDNYTVKYNVLSSNIYLDMKPDIRKFFSNNIANKIDDKKIQAILAHLRKKNKANYENTIFNDEYHMKMESGEEATDGASAKKENNLTSGSGQSNLYIMKKNIFFDSKKEYYKKFLSFYTYEEIFRILCNDNSRCSVNILNSLDDVNKNTFILRSHLTIKNELKKFFQVHQSELLSRRRQGKSGELGVSSQPGVSSQAATRLAQSICPVQKQNIFSTSNTCPRQGGNNPQPVPCSQDNLIKMNNVDDYLNTYYVSYHDSFKVVKREQYYSILSHIFESYLNKADSPEMAGQFPHQRSRHSISINYLGMLPEIVKAYKTFKYCNSLYALGNTYIRKGAEGDTGPEAEEEQEAETEGEEGTQEETESDGEDDSEEEDEEEETNGEPANAEKGKPGEAGPIQPHKEITNEIAFLKRHNHKYMKLFQQHVEEEIKFINFFEVLIKKKVAVILEKNEFLKLYIFYGKKKLPTLPYTNLFFNCRTIIKIEVLRDVNTKQIIYSSRSFFLETLITLKEYKIRNESAYIIIETSDETSSIKKRLKMEMLYRISPMSHINAYIISNNGRETVYHKGNLYQRSANDIKDVISDIRNDFLNIILPQYNLFDLFDSHIYIIICLKNENC